GIAGDSRTSSVSGRNDSPRTATLIPSSEVKCFLKREKTCRCCLSFTLITAVSNGIGMPAFRPCAISALTSFGRQLPPKPHPAQRKPLIDGQARLPSGKTRLRYLLKWRPFMTSTISTPPNLAHKLPSSLENEIIVAKSAFEAYLIISAVLL